MQAALRTDSASRHDAELSEGYTWPTVDRVEADLVEYGDRVAHAIGKAIYDSEKGYDDMQEKGYVNLAKPIDEIVFGDRVVLLDGRPAVVEYNDAFVVRQGPRSTVLKHRLTTLTADGSTVYVEARRREFVPIIAD